MSDSNMAAQMSQQCWSLLEGFVTPLLQQLDECLDKRLVRTFLHSLQALICFRNRSGALLLSELGGYILNPAQAPAGTKRLSNLLRSPKWSPELIAHFLWAQADQQLRQLEAKGVEALVVWDESVLEKAESIAAEGLCPVRSSKAARLKRIKPGYFNPPGGRPVFVPGLHSVALLVLGLTGCPTLAAMAWWTTRGKFASDQRAEEYRLLQACAAAWSRRVLHVWDRGFAGLPWLTAALERHQRFVMRWPANYTLRDEQGQVRKAWEIVQGKRNWRTYQLWDARRRCSRTVGVLAAYVHHPQLPQGPLWLVVSRPGSGRKPWYLLTTEPIAVADDVWHLVLCYSRRWQVEMTWRYHKTELGMESPRLWFWENRRKLLTIVTLAYAFLLSLAHPAHLQLRRDLLRNWCHRTGKWSQTVVAPLYRLRSGLSRLWLAYPPGLQPILQIPG